MNIGHHIEGPMNKVINRLINVGVSEGFTT
jgi:hypothetical protein